MPKITFINRDGSETVVDAKPGLSVMETAVDNGIDIEAACEGSLACATCHLVVVDQEWYDKLGAPSDDEEDMLDLAFGLTKTSRLSCQIRVTEELDGVRFRVPDDF
ncbi:2Fe-2S iron-sulfur cluster binding domain-containing protein [Rhodospirillaceae bacterium KN72]|uniref:2Fe-2S iron-sulfur cluster binding domain-containing protein n=1 Tax=Pacificispira spongiicola TaxID=2729598 RepID=A0A7Y0DZP1_9PROT|nr:ferredoxin family 2Fe-2S iron-sulfur cluster binding protein [Pacificispira spongiicola]NMM44567.1 2Fe-2S iron-sulfur cluster binding domain-containing protein [Pacificispira spongiicola]